MEWISSRGICAGIWALVLAVSMTARPIRAADTGSEEKILGRFPAVVENGRKLAQVNLRDLLQLVMERNLTLQSSGASQDAARNTLEAAQQRLQPTLTSSVGSARSVTPGFTALVPMPGQVSTSFFSLLAQNSQTASAGISQQDWLGITYSLNYQDIRQSFQNLTVQNEGDSPLSGSNSTAVDYSSFTGTVTIPLAQNSGRDVNRIPVGQAEVGVRAARLATRRQELATLNNVAQAYWNLIGQLETVAVNEDAVAVDQHLLRDNQERFKVGRIALADLVATQAQLAKDQFNLVQSRLQALNLEDLLRQAIGLEDVDFGFKPEDTPALRSASYDLNEELARVYRNNPDLATLQGNLENNSYDMLNARNAARPQLNVGLSYSLNGFSKDPLSNSPYYAESQTQGYTASLSYSVPLFDRVGPANIQRRSLEGEAIQLQIQNQRTTLNIQLQTVLRNIRQAEEQVTAAKAAVESARAQLKNEIDRLALGRSTTLIVAQVQQQLAQAEQSEIAARVQFEQNDATRMAMTAELYDHYHLKSQAIDPQ